jgi:hypothetical protein
MVCLRVSSVQEALGFSEYSLTYLRGMMKKHKKLKKNAKTDMKVKKRIF